jgi:hypothetical protein
MPYAYIPCALLPLLRRLYLSCLVQLLTVVIAEPKNVSFTPGGFYLSEQYRLTLDSAVFLMKWLVLWMYL